MDAEMAEKLVKIVVQVKDILPDHTITVLARDTDDITGDHVLITGDKLPAVIEALEDLQRSIKD